MAIFQSPQEAMLLLLKHLLQQKQRGQQGRQLLIYKGSGNQAELQAVQSLLMPEGAAYWCVPIPYKWGVCPTRNSASVLAHSKLYVALDRTSAI